MGHLLKHIGKYMTQLFIYQVIYMGGSINGGTPIAGWFTMENSLKIDENWGYPYFRKPPYVGEWVDFLQII